jgi:hypothetical protein
MSARNSFASRTLRRRQRRGVALLYALLAMATAATMIAVTMNVALSSSKHAQIRQYGGEARYLADGAIERGKFDIAEAVANFQPVPAGGTAVINGISVPYTVTPTGFNSITADPAGIQTIVNGYEIQATASVMDNSSTMHRLVNTEATPVFQFAVFYTDDLEINPGPSMLLSGRVHTNANMYLNCGATLTLNTNYLRAVGGIFRNRKDDPNISLGDVNVRKWVLNPFDPTLTPVYFPMKSWDQMDQLGITTSSGYDSAFDKGFDANGDGDYNDPNDWYGWGPGALAYWSQPAGYTGGTGYTVMSGVHGLTKAAVPHIGSIKMYEPTPGGAFYYDAAMQKYLPALAGQGTHDMGYYHAQADLSIITYADGTTRAYDHLGNELPATILTAISSKSMYDCRQAGGGAGNVALTEIDLSVLSALGMWPANGLLYAASYGAGTGTNAKGIRLVNGSDLPDKLTVVSEDPVYIKGDFNTVQKKGAAVIADAVNLLSGAWNDANKSPTSALPTAIPTTYNLAIITGNNTTVAGGQYNGGLENLPRFHEKWTGVNCKITGSFVNTWNSQYATGDWVIAGNYYQPPNRLWTYDPQFNQVANLPPFTPMAVTANDVAAW